ncbi:MAG: class I SAM-dependent DNA methyltransferase, partial [Bacteroidales bacterium]|nr:class I SAM-dependent DNA methyltransferase [Bacteroidales bacterium]
LVFCLFAEDAGIFGHKRMFGDYIRTFPANKVRRALLDLFRVLDQKPEERDPYLEEELAAFPYVNGGLFSEEDATIPQFTEELKDLLCRKASDDFDWSEISPTIFGAIFESTLNPVTRRVGGMHYTSIENIHKVIDPLFMDALKAEFNEIASIKLKKTRDEKLAIFQRKMGALTFLDPACGSGNFLTESFISLRRLENDCLRLRFGEAGVLDVYDDAIQVHIRQFYGIEINDFATTVAKTALWIAESQMMAETAEILHRNLEFLPLKSYANIRKGDALKLDWCEVEASAEKIPEIYAQHANIYLDESLLAKEKDVVFGEVNVHVGSIGAGKQSFPEKKQVIYDYIIGNPPFVGARMMSQEQKDALLDVFGKKWKNAGNLDFVCAWYKKAAEIVEGRKTRAALVSTNSVCQGETVANLWQPLMTRYGVKIDFAHRTFRWDSESEQKAHVHCVIVGFSHQDNDVNKKLIFDGENKIVAQNINGYLLDAENIFVQSRNKPLCEVPQMDFGNMPNDAKGMLSNFTKEEKEYYCKKYPELNPVFRRLFGSEEYINNKERYCLWFVKQDLSVIRRIPEIKSRIEKVKDARASSSRQGTRKLADYPYLFGEIRQPETDFIIIPRVSSERRGYVPIGFLAPENIVNDSVQVIPDATLYHFGILTSHVHMAWMRAVCGRLKSDYRYSKDIVYNNFPWPTPNEEQKAKIEQTAQAILDARALYPDSSLADLYDEVVMPIELRKAHQANDRAVMAAYGFPVKDFTEQDCVARLMEIYQKLIENQ